MAAKSASGQSNASDLRIGLAAFWLERADNSHDCCVGVIWYFMVSRTYEESIVILFIYKAGRSGILEWFHPDPPSELT